MLSVSSMALAAMLGSACGTNMANINDCNAALLIQKLSLVQYQKGGQDLNSMLSQMGVGMMPGNSQCGVN